MDKSTKLQRLLDRALEFATREIFHCYSDLAKKEQDVQKLAMYSMSEFLNVFCNEIDFEDIIFEDVSLDYNYDLNDGDELFALFMSKQPSIIKLKYAIEVTIRSYVYENINDSYGNIISHMSIVNKHHFPYEYCEPAPFAGIDQKVNINEEPINLKLSEELNIEFNEMFDNCYNSKQFI